MPGAYAVTFEQLHSVFSFRFQPVNGVSFAALSCVFGYGPISVLAEAGFFHIPLFHGKVGDEFWTKVETLLDIELIGYIHYEAPEGEQNFATLIEFINAMEV